MSNFTHYHPHWKYLSNQWRITLYLY